MSEALQKIKRITLQVLLLLACYFVSRCVITMLNRELFSGITLSSFLRIAFFSLRYDISAIIIVNILYWVLFLLPVGYSSGRWQKFIQAIFIILNAIAFAFEISDWAYLRFNQKRATADVMDMISRKGDFYNQLPHLLTSFWYVPVSWLLFVLILAVTNKKIVAATPVTKPLKNKGTIRYTIDVAMLLMVIGLSIIGIRGGFNRIPIGPRDALKVADSKYVPIVLNTPFSIATTFHTDKLPTPNYLPDEEACNYIHPVKQYPHTGFRKMNVVVIILESFSKEYTGLGNGMSYTPFLDSLMRQSLTCSNAYANALRSADGIPAILAGIPTFIDEPFTTSAYGTNKITALPCVLKSEGYTSAFFHGGTNGTMDFDAFAASAGYDNYYGRTEYKNDEDYDGVWGIWDEPFLQYFAQTMGTMQQPFVTTVFTLSSHDPFKVPTQYEHSFPPSIPIGKAIRYTDMALRNFFKKAATQPWYKNTLFVISADHPSPERTDTAYYNKGMGLYAIPILFYAPGDSTLKGYDHELAQQIDILPSVLDYLGYNKPFFALGNSIFSPANRYVTEHFQMGNELVNNNYYLRAYDDSPYGLYHFPTDSLCRYDLLGVMPSVKDSELKFMRAYLQVTYRALINNKMWVNPATSRL